MHSDSDYVRNNLNEILEESTARHEAIDVPSNLVKDAVEFFDNLKRIYYSETCSRSQQIQILTLIPQSWSAADIMKNFDATWRTIDSAKKSVALGEMLATPIPKRGKSLSSEVTTLVKAYYLRDDVSSVMPGMKDVISVRNENGVKEYLQKRLLLLNLKELYQSFKEDYPELKIGFAKFSTLRPPNCVLVGSSGTHSVCVCSYHQNVKLLLLGCSITFDCFNFLLCKTPQESCYFGRCNRCPNKVKFEETLEKLFEDSNILSVTYKQWISNPKTTLETIIKTTEEFIPYLCEELCKLMPHAFIATQQSVSSRSTKENLEEGEFQVIADFAANYAFTVQDAIPRFHWNNDQATVYNIVIYYKENIDVKHRSLVIISDSLTH